MQLYFAVPDTATTHDGVLVRSFLRQCAVSTDLARAVKFRGGGFFADGVPVLANRRIYPGQMLSFALPPEGDGVTPQPEIPVNVVYEDAFAVVLEKPPQLAVHPTLNYPGGTLANGYAAWAAAHGQSCIMPSRRARCRWGKEQSMHPSAAGAIASSGAALPPRASPAAPSILL